MLSVHSRSCIRLFVLGLMMATSLAWLAAQTSPAGAGKAAAPAGKTQPAASPAAAGKAAAPATSAKPGTTPAGTPKPSPSPSATPKPATSAPVTGKTSTAPKASPSPSPKATPAPAAVPSPSPSPPASPLPPNSPDGLYALIETTKGRMIANLDWQQSPLAVTAFVGLAEGSLEAPAKPGTPFYDASSFHRVVPGTLVQAGSPVGRDATWADFRVAGEIDPAQTFSRPGVMALANDGPDSSTCQFFITTAASPWLAGRHSALGQVISGLDIANRLVQGDALTKISIIRKGSTAEAFRADSAAFETAKAGLAERKRKMANEQLAKLLPGAQKTPDGRWFVIERPGSGSSPLAGQTVSMQYVGRFLSGQTFDSSAEPVSLKVGTGRIIAGWDQTLMEMKAGEKRTVAIPPELAFGESGVDNGAENAIPPNAWIVVDIELLSVGN